MNHPAPHPAGRPAVLASPGRRGPRLRAIATVLAVLAVGGLLAACQAAPRQAEAAPDEAVLLARIAAEVGDAPCQDDAQCRTLALGVRPCGGPQRWLPWSSAQGRAPQLQAWADELAALERARQAREGLASDCRYLPDPGAVCVARRCVLSSARDPSPGKPPAAAAVAR